jgi:hypothetical protein
MLKTSKVNNTDNIIIIKKNKAKKNNIVSDEEFNDLLNDTNDIDLNKNDKDILIKKKINKSTKNIINDEKELLTDKKDLNNDNIDEENKSTENTQTIQRKVNKDLGKNITKHHDIIYDEIEKKIGCTKKCNFGHTRGSKTGIKHEGDENVNIRDFELKGVKYDDETNKVVFEKGSDGLQGFCKGCSKRRRKKRLDTQKELLKDKTPEEVHKYYKDKYGKETKNCSRCNEELNITEFNISIGMECGLHNVCKKCSLEYGNSVGERWIIYLPDGNYNYNKSNKKINDDTDNDNLIIHDDHIFPISLGGSNFEINHQLLDSKKNISKSNNIDFENINDIKKEMISERFQNILLLSKNINDLKIKLEKAMYNDILLRSKKTNEELEKMYSEYCKKYNLRRDIKRAVKKFRNFCELRNIK